MSIATAMRGFLSGNLLRFDGNGAGCLQVAIGDHDVRAAVRCEQHRLPAYTVPPPTTSKIWRLSSFSGGCRRIFASSSAQYSIRNASDGGSAT